MKIIINKNKKEQENFPCLKIANNELLVLFTCSDTGTVINPGKSIHSIGYTSTGWDSSQFSLFNDEVILKND